MLFLGVLAAADVSVAVADAVADAVAIDIAVAFNGNGIDAFLDSDDKSRTADALCVGVDGVVVAGDAAVPSAVVVALLLCFLLPPVLPFFDLLPIPVDFLLPLISSYIYRYRDNVGILLPVILVQEIKQGTPLVSYW